MKDSIVLTVKIPMRMEPRVLVHDTIFVLPDGRLAFLPSGSNLMVPTQSGPLTIEAKGDAQCSQ